MKEQSVEEQIDQLREEIKRDIARWISIDQHGCNDPSWPDGCNMNLCRNHVIHAKNYLRSLCEEHKIPLPEEYYLPAPPKVDNGHMADRKQKERVKRLEQMGNKLTSKKVEYDPEQMSLF